MRLARLCSLIVIPILLLGVGCTPTSGSLERETMPTQPSPLAGNWTRITQSECAQIYPDSIDFQPGRLYFSQQEQPGTFTLWDVGTYEVVDPQHVQISTANDALITYRFSIQEDVLTFTDPQDCEFSYRRA